MRVAIIERSSETRDEIKNCLKGSSKTWGVVDPEWEIDFYVDPEKFFNNDCSEYDIVMVDCDLGGDKLCFDFIHRIYNTTDAELCILTDGANSKTLANLLNDDHINYILYKSDIGKIMDHLNYSSSRLKIKSHLLNESAIYTEISSKMF